MRRRNVTAGVDGSAAALAACEWAAREAELHGTSLRLVHAVTPLPGRITLTNPTDPAPRPRAAARAPAETESRIRAEHPDLRVIVDEVAARPVDALVTTAADAEMVVLGSHGSGAVTGALLGSVEREVAGRAPCPVVLVPAGSDTDEAPGTEEPAPVQSVVLGLAPGRTGAGVIGFAFGEAAVRGQTLRVVHGRTPGDAEAAGEAGDFAAGGRARPIEEAPGDLPAELAPWQAEYPQVDVTGEPALGGASRYLADAASSASLVVLGRSFDHGASRLDAVAQAVLHDGSAPVAVIPDGYSRAAG